MAGRGDPNPTPAAVAVAVAVAAAVLLPSAFFCVDAGLLERVRRATGGDGVLVTGDGTSAAPGWWQQRIGGTVAGGGRSAKRQDEAKSPTQSLCQRKAPARMRGSVYLIHTYRR